MISISYLSRWKTELELWDVYVSGILMHIKTYQRPSPLSLVFLMYCNIPAGQEKVGGVLTF